MTMMTMMMDDDDDDDDETAFIEIYTENSPLYCDRQSL